MLREKRVRRLMHEAACLADASTRGDDKRAEIARLRGEAAELLDRKIKTQMDLKRAATHPSTQYTEPAWGAQPGEPLLEFTRALRRTLLGLGASQDVADQLVGNGSGDEGQTGEAKKGGTTGRARRERA